MENNMKTIVKSSMDEIDLKAMGLELNQLIVLAVAGSHMYGTSTMESDRDYLGIYMPTRRQLLLNDYPKQVSLPKESGLDLQIWSIHYFIKLACQGETLSIDLLHAPDRCLVACDPDLWYYITGNRKRFYTKEMKAFISYARKQAAKYGLKGDRIAAIEKVIAFLDTKHRDWHIGKNDEVTKPYLLREIWDDLPKGDHIHFLDTKPLRMYQVCGKKFQETVKISYIKEHLQKSLTEYGERAMLAKENKGVDWKAVSHALRSAYQIYDILTFGDYEYPLKNADFIKNVKLGKHDFVKTVQPILEDVMDNIERLSEHTDLPLMVNKEFWNEWLMFLMEDYVLH